MMVCEVADAKASLRSRQAAEQRTPRVSVAYLSRRRGREHFLLAIWSHRCYQEWLRCRHRFAGIASRVSEKRAARLQAPYAAMDLLPNSRISSPVPDVVLAADYVCGSNPTGLNRFNEISRTGHCENTKTALAV